MTNSIINRMFYQTLALVTVFALGAVEAAEVVQIIHGPEAAPLEKLAANELADILGRVFDDIEVGSGSDVAERSGTVIFVGSPDTNPNIARHFPDWPKVTDQGIVIRSAGEKQVHAVGGGSPAATLWAVYEMGHRLGIRYLLRGDLNPINRRPFDLAKMDATLEPQVRQRGWETIGVGAHTFESWGLAAQQRVIKQLAKMKFNHLILKLEPWHPFVSYDFKGVARSTATFWNGRQYPLTGDFVGKKAFVGATLFQHPEFKEADTSAEMFAAGKRFLTAIIDTASQYGMTVSVQFHRYMHALEFARILPNTTMADDGFLGCISSSSLGASASMSRELLATEMKACFDAYSGVDQVCWPAIEVESGRFNVLSGTDRREPLNQVPTLNEEQIHKVLHSVVPAPAKGARLSLAVHTSSLDMLPQTQVHGVDQTWRAAVKAGWSSVSIGPPSVSEFGQDVHFVSRAMWDTDLEPHASHTALWAVTTGNKAAAERLWLARQHLEKATSRITANDQRVEFNQAFARLAPGMLIKRHYIPTPIPDWWQEVTDAYTQYMIELYRAHGAIDGDAKPILFYYAKRGEYVLEYLGAVKAVREAALAKQAGDKEKAIEHLEHALELTYNCINTLSDVAQDQSDRGLIAALNAYAYRPLMTELERLSGEE